MFRRSLVQPGIRQKTLYFAGFLAILGRPNRSSDCRPVEPKSPENVKTAVFWPFFACFATGPAEKCRFEPVFKSLKIVADFSGLIPKKTANYRLQRKNLLRRLVLRLEDSIPSEA